MGDTATLEWAREFMNSSDKDRWMAYYVIAHSPSESADTLAKNVINGTNAVDLSSLIQGYGESQNPNKFDRLKDVINSGNKDPKVKQWLKITLQEIFEEGDSRAAGLLKQIEN